MAMQNADHGMMASLTYQTTQRTTTEAVLLTVSANNSSSPSYGRGTWSY